MSDYLVQEEDGTSRLTLEDATGSILLEDGTGPTSVQVVTGGGRRRSPRTVTQPYDDMDEIVAMTLLTAAIRRRYRVK